MLEVSDSYMTAKPEERERIVNTCGPEGSSSRIPDGAFGANFIGACKVHDWDYAKGEITRREADWRFRRNLYKCASAAPWYLRPLAYAAARWYFRATRVGGRRSYSG